MKASILYGPNDIKYEEVPDPQCPEKGIVLEIKACGICGSDLRTMEGGSKNKIYPSIIGHEITGEIIESNNSEYNIGDFLAVAPIVPCGECWYCKQGIQNLCDNMREIGLATGIAGGFAEYMSLTEELLKKGYINKISQDSDLVTAVVNETASSCLQAQINTNMVMEDLVLIIGGGTIGLLHSEIAKIRGARETIVAELNSEKAELAVKQGFNEVVNHGSSDKELKKIVMDKTKGRGADVVITACPSGQAQADALSLVRKRGKVILFGGIPKDKKPFLDTNLIHYKEIEIYGASAYTPIYNKKALDLVTSGRINANKFITHKYSLDELEQAFKDMKDGKMIKGVVIP